MAKPIVHIVGAGLAGLAAAVRLADGPFDIVLHEAACQAGGRARSYYDPALGTMIDNGNHLLLSGNRAALDYLATIGGEKQLAGPSEAEFDFYDLASGAVWRLRPNNGLIPWWIFVPARRVPGTHASEYFSLLKLFLSGRDVPLGSQLGDRGLLYERLWRPFFLAALNLDPRESSSHLARAVVQETLAKGGRACQPLIAHAGLSATFVDPALAYIAARGIKIDFEHRLRAMAFASGRVNALDFGHGLLPLGPLDKIILAVPAHIASTFLPGLSVPKETSAIVNAHFRIAASPDFPPLIGVVNGLIEWLFSFPDRLSVTISGADRLLNVPREELASLIWADVAKVTQIEKPLPAWQIIKEKRATFAATVAVNGCRPGPQTAFTNLLLAGDWTATGLPATIEGAIRSGHRAASLILS
ncbi:MAG: hydroxysqualene dehydroxylase HpnE [Alphaproteobacteria bacterium]|nr:hydroxysqualene dehydroxylase HpnE [Alphaproteobacteria bacterium]